MLALYLYYSIICCVRCFIFYFQIKLTAQEEVALELRANQVNLALVCDAYIVPSIICALCSLPLLFAGGSS